MPEAPTAPPATVAVTVVSPPRVGPSNASSSSAVMVVIDWLAAVVFAPDASNGGVAVIVSDLGVMRFAAANAAFVAVEAV